MWNGYRIFGVGGSMAALPASGSLAGYFGTNGKGSAARMPILCDMLNDIVAYALIEPKKKGGRALAMAHIKACAALGCAGRKLLVFDRGYASFKMVEELGKQGLYFLMRVKRKFNLEIYAQEAAGGHVFLEKGGKRIKVRVVKFKLESGEMEMLITNVWEKRLGKKAFKKLCFLRWPTEVKYDIVKNKLQVGNFNAMAAEGAKQDFFACMLLANLAAAAAADALNEICRARKKHQYKANMNELVGIIKDHLADAILKTARKGAKVARAIVVLAELYVVPRRPGRSTPRRAPRKGKFHHNKKANC